MIEKIEDRRIVVAPAYTKIQPIRICILDILPFEDICNYQFWFFQKIRNDACHIGLAASAVVMKEEDSTNPSASAATSIAFGIVILVFCIPC